MAQDMTTDEFHVEQELRDLYYDPEGGYSSLEVLYGRAKDAGLKVSRRQIGEWLRSQETYSKFKFAKATGHKRGRRVFVEELGDQLQMDLVDMKKFKSSNYDHYWILTAIEVLSRYAFAVPVLRKDTENMTDAVGIVLDEFSEHFGISPKTVQFDLGSEFYNVGVKELLKSRGIKYFSTTTGRKASIVERFNRTLKTRMWKYFSAEKTSEWLDVLDSFVSGYNGSVNRGIKMKPRDVTEENSDTVFATLYGYGDDVELLKPKFKIGDHVRVHKYKGTFARGFEANFSDEVFSVYEVSRGDPNMYRIKESDGSTVVGRFYESEMSLYTTG